MSPTVRCKSGTEKQLFIAVCGPADVAQEFHKCSCGDAMLAMCKNLSDAALLHLVIGFRSFSVPSVSLHVASMHAMK